MDPDACLKALDEALDNKDRESIYEYAEALIGWLTPGGYNPFDKRIGMDWRANLTLYEIKSYLGDLSRACGIVGE